MNVASGYKNRVYATHVQCSGRMRTVDRLADMLNDPGSSAGKSDGQTAH